jgi:drug/metabolite transporter (DMT)-like permease
LSKASSTFVSPLHRTLTRGESIALVVFCTFIGAAAQILFKIGANKLPAVSVTEMLANPLLVLSDIPLFGGLACYGVFTLLIIFALRDGELSVIYPVIALTYVWVTFLSVVVFHEALNTFKVCGVIVIVVGVAIMGKNRTR